MTLQSAWADSGVDWKLTEEQGPVGGNEWYSI